MEHTALVSIVANDPERSRVACEQVAPAALAARLRTGCVYEAQPPDTVGLLVTRADPRTRRGGRHFSAAIHTHWPLFAPSVQLLTGHETVCRTRRCRGVGRCDGHALLHLGWPAFAAAYRAELEAWPSHTRLAVARQVASWLRTAPTVTILSFESGPPAGSTSKCWAQRHVFREWLRSLLPLALPLGAAQELMAAEQMPKGDAQRSQR
jgi:hypothetical protein